VDTSAWADFLNGHPSAEAAALAELLESDHDLCTCGIVVAEVFQGLRNDRGRAEIVELFRDLVFLELSTMDPYLRAAELYRTLRRRGRTIRSTIDCVLAIIAEEHGCYLLGRDRDLEAIVESGLVKVSRWTLSPPTR